MIKYKTIFVIFNRRQKSHVEDLRREEDTKTKTTKKRAMTARERMRLRKLQEADEKAEKLKWVPSVDYRPTKFKTQYVAPQFLVFVDRPSKLCQISLIEMRTYLSFGLIQRLRGKSVRSWCDGSSYRSFMG